MSRAEWCLFCAQAEPPRHIAATGHFDGDPSCQPCYNAQSRGGTVGEWVPIGKPPEMPLMSMSVRTVPTDTGEEVLCSAGAVMGPEMINPERGETSMETTNGNERRGRPITEEQRQAILAADPKETAVSVARRIGCSDVTVAGVRRKARLEAGASPEMIEERRQDLAEVADAYVERETAFARDTADAFVKSQMPAQQPDPDQPVADEPEESAETQQGPCDTIERIMRDSLNASANAVPARTVVIPLHIDDEIALQLFRRLSLELKAQALGAVIQPLLLA